MSLSDPVGEAVWCKFQHCLFVAALLESVVLVQKSYLWADPVSCHEVLARMQAFR